MRDKKSSFHMGDEFNGNGEKVYIHATEHKIYEPLSQENVRLTPDFSNSLPKMLGALPLLINPANSQNVVTLKALGGIASIEQVIINKDAKTGKYSMNFKLRKIQLTNGSYLHKKRQKERESRMAKC